MQLERGRAALAPFPTVRFLKVERYELERLPFYELLERLLYFELLAARILKSKFS